MKNKLVITLAAFLLLVPFRLPISILFIRFFEWLLGETTTIPLPQDVVSTNVIITKTVYNIVLSTVFLYNIEMISRQQMGRKSRGMESAFYWWCVPVGIMLLVFIIMDGVNIDAIFFK